MIYTGYAMTGYRIGWTRCSPHIAKSLTKLQEPMVSCGVPFAQEGAIVALRDCDSFRDDMVKEYKARRDAALAILKTRGYQGKYTPGGAFYLAVDISSGGEN